MQRNVESPRYIARKEFFGALIWDKKLQTYFGISNSLFESLKKIKANGIESITEDEEEVLKENSLISENEKNFEIVKEENKSEGFVDYPLRVHLAITEKCNMNCKHCFFQGVKDSQPGNSEEREINIDDMKRLFDDMVKNGCYELFIAGGEPLVKDNFLSIVKEANKRDIMIKIFTNGLYLTDPLIEELNKIENLYYVSISLESTDRETYESIRGNFYDKFLERLNALSKKAEFKTYLRWSIGKKNIKEYEEIVEFSKEVGIPNIKVRPIVPSGNALDNPEMVPTYEEYLRFLKNIIDYSEEKGVKVEGSFTLHYDPTLRFSKKTIGFSEFVPIYTGFGGQGGYTSVYIDPNGYVNYCAMVYPHFPPSEKDNIKESDLSELWFNSKSIKEKRGLSGNEKCLSCSYYPTCRGGCRARAYFEHQDFNAPDPWCIKDLEEENPKLMEEVSEKLKS